MQAIWKYKVPIQDEFEIEMPIGAKVLSVDHQHGVVQMWALVDPNVETPTEMRKFHVFGTGHPHEPEAFAGRFIGTVVTVSGALVWHVFEAE